MRIREEWESDGIEDKLPPELRAQWRELKRIMLRIQIRQLLLDRERAAATAALLEAETKDGVAV